MWVGGGGGVVAKSCLTLATPWTVVCQAPLSMGLSRQVYWSGLPFPSPGDLPDPRIKPSSPAMQAYSLPTELQGKSFCGLVANFYSIKAKKIPASRLALGDWLGYCRVTIGVGIFA